MPDQNDASSPSPAPSRDIAPPIPREKPSERMFRRSRRLEERRRKAAAEDARFFRAVFSLCAVTAVLALILAWLGTTGGLDVSALTPHMQPWIGPFSKIDIIGGLFVLSMGLLLWKRTQKKR